LNFAVKKESAYQLDRGQYRILCR